MEGGNGHFTQTTEMALPLASTTPQSSTLSVSADKQIITLE